jgi:hypothetical protein
MKQCEQCGKDFERDLGSFCGNECYNAYFFRGRKTRPIKWGHQLEFERPMPYEDCKKTLQMMEDAGQLNTPDAKQAAAVKMAALESRPREVIDYQETGHPCWE